MKRRPPSSTRMDTRCPYTTRCRSIDANEAGRSQGQADEAGVETGASRNAAQSLLFRDTNARIRGVRLSVIERVEEVPVSSLFESAGRVQVQIGEDIFPVHAAALPGGEGTLKLLRLYAAQAVLCYPIAEVIDIVRLPDPVQRSAGRQSVV